MFCRYLLPASEHPEYDHVTSVENLKAHRSYTQGSLQNLLYHVIRPCHRITEYTGIVTNKLNSNLPTEVSVNTVKVCPPTLCKRNGCSLGALTDVGFPPISLILASSSFKVNDT